jgi:feruloyl esterase
VAKALVKIYYGAEQKKAYFAGCSTGGRRANMKARKFPNDFDGIISGAPALDQTGLPTYQAWLVQANTGPDGRDILPKQKIALVRDKVYEACDAKDGLKDGLIDDPRACDFKPASLRCRASDGADCLTAGEVGVLEKWYAGARDSRGRQLYPGGVPLGSEPFWPLWLTGLEKGGGQLTPRFITEFLRYAAFADDPGESYSVAKFSFDSDPQRLATMAPIYKLHRPRLERTQGARRQAPHVSRLGRSDRHAAAHGRLLRSGGEDDGRTRGDARLPAPVHDPRGSSTAGGSRGRGSRSLFSIRSLRSKTGGEERSASEPARH